MPKNQPPTPDTPTLRELDRKHHLHPFTNHHQMRKTNGARIITKAEGVYIHDSDNNRYLDAMAGLWCVNLGYGREELTQAAAAQLRQLPYYNSFFQTAQLPAVALAEILAEVTPAQYNLAFFGCTGSDANDTIIRLARLYWQLQDQPDRQVIISRHNAYHGSTIAGASLGGMAFMHAQGGLPIPDIAHIAQPYYFGRDQADAALTPDQFGIKTARALEEKITELGKNRVAAFIAEPIQGAGGVIIPPDSYWREIQRICQKYDILLIVDEVICGFGRTGNWFGSDTFNIQGDLMTLAKGMSSGYQPISAVMVSDRVRQVLDAHDHEFSHGYTYSGHPVACAVALKNIQILRDERIIENARENLAYLTQQIQTLSTHPIIGETRTCGAVGALEIVASTPPKPTDKLTATATDKPTATATAPLPQRFPADAKAGETCRDFAFANGLIMRAVGDTMVFSPPLIITRPEIDEFVQKAAQALDQTQKHLTAG